MTETCHQGLIIIRIYADGYTLEAFDDRDDGLPSDQSEQGNNPSYYGSALSQLDISDVRAIPIDQLRAMAKIEAAEIAAKLTWREYAIQVDEYLDLLIKGQDAEIRTD